MPGSACIPPLFIPKFPICIFRVHFSVKSIARGCYHPRKCRMIQIVRLGQYQCSRYPKLSEVAQPSLAPNECRIQQRDIQTIGTCYIGTYYMGAANRRSSRSYSGTLDCFWKAGEAMKIFQPRSPSLFVFLRARAEISPDLQSDFSFQSC
jgi:hypothetical protein